MLFCCLSLLFIIKTITAVLLTNIDIVPKLDRTHSITKNINNTLGLMETKHALKNPTIKNIYTLFSNGNKYSMYTEDGWYLCILQGNTLGYCPAQGPNTVFTIKRKDDSMYKIKYGSSCLTYDNSDISVVPYFAKCKSKNDLQRWVFNKVNCNSLNENSSSVSDNVDLNNKANEKESSSDSSSDKGSDKKKDKKSSKGLKGKIKKALAKVNKKSKDKFKKLKDKFRF
ncbi:hypothetical protein SLOPH_535 [Spraguea lophii 42_110]|uniref:Uncharacterized protein n=1 Tax=Spraguea lophii (strain 42_110) TaxID=1358809 RepID=S7XVD2_SPRLO|nr:hypothetical protein SLOPH_535 [Spraguea lophii 42_110]